MDAISLRYAQSLFELAKEEKAIETYQKDMLKVEDVFQDEAIVKFFSHVALEDQAKFEVLQKSFQNQVSPYVYNFLALLIKKRRMNYIRGICQQFENLCNDYFGIKVGKVYSAYALQQDEIEKVEKVISQKEGKEVHLKLVIDENLIGGVKVQVDNHVYDHSLSHKLESLRLELLRK